MIQFTYELAKQNIKDVVVIGAGPSVNTNKSIYKHIKENNSTVISTGYNFPIKSDYCMFSGKDAFAARYKDITCQNIIITPHVLLYNKKRIERDLKHKYYIVQTRIPNKGVSFSSYWNSNIEVDENCFFNHKLKNCGFTTILAAHFFLPKSITILGMDGPNWDTMEHPHFYGSSKKFLEKDAYDRNKQKADFLVRIVEFLGKHNIAVNIYNNDTFWGIKDRISKFPWVSILKAS